MTGDPQTLIERLVSDAYNQGNLAVIDDLFASTVQANGHVQTVADVKEAVGLLRQLIPGLCVTLDAVEMVGDCLVTRWTFHRSTPTGVTTRRSLRLFRIKEGRIVEVWYDRAARDQLDDLDPLFFE